MKAERPINNNSSITNDTSPTAKYNLAKQYPTNTTRAKRPIAIASLIKSNTISTNIIFTIESHLLLVDGVDWTYEVMN